MTDVEEMKEIESGQGTGFAGKLYVVWGKLVFPMAGLTLLLDVAEGKLNFLEKFGKDADALSINLMENPNIVTLVAGQKEGENMTRSVVTSARDMLLANLMNDTVLVVDLDAALSGMGRREDADG